MRYTVFVRNNSYLNDIGRVLAYKKEELILSKQEGGKWGICNVPEKYHSLIVQALDEYLSDKSTEWDENNTHEYATYMVTQIRN